MRNKRPISIPMAVPITGLSFDVFELHNVYTFCGNSSVIHVPRWQHATRLHDVTFMNVLHGVLDHMLTVVQTACSHDIKARHDRLFVRGIHRWQEDSPQKGPMMCRAFPYYDVVMHDDVIKWKHFPRNWPFVREIHRSPVNFPHKGQWRGALMFSLIYAWMNDWVNNREAGDLRRQHGHYDVIVMGILHIWHQSWW